MYKYENTRYNITDTELQYVPTQPQFKRKVQNPFLSNKVVGARILGIKIKHSVLSYGMLFLLNLTKSETLIP